MCPSAPARPAPPHHGGADAFGYTWTITGDEQATPFEWQDISTIGTAVALFDDDYTVTPMAIPFNFPFYGVDYTQVYIGSNGLVGFDPTNLSSLGNTILPNGFVPNAVSSPRSGMTCNARGGWVHPHLLRSVLRALLHPVHGMFRPIPPGGSTPSRSC
jgi:hypothetical protein